MNTNAFFIPDFDANGTPTTDITGSDTDGPTDHDDRRVHRREGRRQRRRGRAAPRRARRSSADLHVAGPQQPRHRHQRLHASSTCCRRRSSSSAARRTSPPGYTAGTDNTVDAPDQRDRRRSRPTSTRARAGCRSAPPRRPASSPPRSRPWPTAAPASRWNIGRARRVGEPRRRTACSPSPTSPASRCAPNTDTWPNGKPTDASLGQGRNLDNNDGAPTSEEASEPGVINTVTADRHLSGPVDVRHEPHAHRVRQRIGDLRGPRRSASRRSGQVDPGHHRHVDPRRRDRASTATSPTSSSPTPCPTVCARSPRWRCRPTPTAGPAPTRRSTPAAAPIAAPYTSAVENADGTWTLVWDHTTIAGLAALAHSSR